MLRFGATAHAPHPSSPEQTQVVSTPAAPPDIDAASLSSATGAQLKFWVDQANVAAGRKVLTKSGKVNDLRQRLAAHHHLNLTAAPSAVAAAAPSPLSTLDIQNRQWNALCDLGDEWDEYTRTNKPFRLCAAPSPPPGEHELASSCLWSGN